VCVCVCVCVCACVCVCVCDTALKCIIDTLVIALVYHFDLSIPNISVSPGVGTREEKSKCRIRHFPFTFCSATPDQTEEENGG
jgi:hypothetical protein